MKAHLGSRLSSVVLALALAAPALRAQKTSVASDVKGALTPDQSKMWAAQTSPNEIRLAWAHVVGAVSYTIGCAAGSEPPRVVATVGAPGGIINAVAGAVQRLQYVVVTRVAGTYDCWVRATDPKGSVSPDVHFNKVSTLEKAALTRLAPERVTATETAPNEITVTWTAVPGATAYFIGRAVAPAGFAALCDLCPTTTTYVDRAVTPGARHTYTVGALTPKGGFPRTSSNAVTPGGGATASGDSAGGSSASGGAPTDIKAAFDDDSKSAVRVTWRPVDGANAYRVLREVDGVVTVLAQFTPAGIVVRNGVQVMEFVDRLVSQVLSASSKRQVVVRYRIVAMFPSSDPAKSLSAPAASNELVVEAKAATADAGAVAYVPPGNAVATATSATSVRLTWTPAAGAESCDIERSSNGSAYVKLVSRPAYIATYIDASTNVPTLHPRYRITCGDAKGAAHPPVAFTIPTWDPKAANPKSGV